MRTLFQIVLFGLLASIANATEVSQPAVAPAKTPQTQLELLEQMESLEKAMDVLKQADASLDTMMRTRKLKCLKAFGHESFCQCLNETLAVWNALQSDEEPSDSSKRWRESNECFYLFHPAQKWSRSDGRSFAQAAWNYLGLS
jgi:hypothetical protein